MTVYNVVADKRFASELKRRFTKPIQKQILQYIVSNIDQNTNPRQIGFSQSLNVIQDKETAKEWGYDIDMIHQRLLVYIWYHKVILLTISHKPQILPALVNIIDYDSLISIRELCSELEISYNSLL
jgi:hypothetical protein